MFFYLVVILEFRCEKQFIKRNVFLCAIPLALDLKKLVIFDLDEIICQMFEVY